MKSVTITFPDKSERQYPEGVTPAQIAKDISQGLLKSAIAAKIDGNICDLATPLNKNCQIEIISKKSAEGIEVIRHSTAHLLAQAVKELYPKTQITIGPVTAEGFYYDFDRQEKFTPEDLPKIEKKMKELAKRNLEITRHEMDKSKASEFFRSIGETFKAEIIEDIPEPIVSVYEQGDFKDLCRGPHVPNTSKLGKFKLLSIAGAYWRGDEKNKMLQRIYGTAFATQEELDTHLKQLEEAKKRDHRKLGQEMELFTFKPVAPSMPFFLPEGTVLYNQLVDFVRREMKSHGYDEVICPQLMSTQLWETSGHLEHFKDDMFFVETDEATKLAFKPMNCPGHAVLFASTKHSYRELPIRMAEFSKLHRNERAGVTHGLLRVRAFCQDDGHIFCREDQISTEVLETVKHTFRIYELFGFKKIDMLLATRGEQFMGDKETWDRATAALEKSLKDFGQPFSINPGEAAFYGPKIEFQVQDSIGRSWQLATIQLDFSLPERFQLEYVDQNDQGKRPVMIHRAILGSFERFMGVLIEHHAGHLPIWIAPTQVMLINVTSNEEEYTKSILEKLTSWDVRARVDLRNEKMGYKIRQAQLKRIPLMLILGKQEASKKTVSVRKASGETLNDLTLEDFEKFLKPQLKPGGINH